MLKISLYFFKQLKKTLFNIIIINIKSAEKKVENNGNKKNEN